MPCNPLTQQTMNLRGNSGDCRGKLLDKLSIAFFVVNLSVHLRWLYRKVGVTPTGNIKHNQFVNAMATHAEGEGFH